MNLEQQAEYRLTQERYLFREACRLDEFSVGDLWEFVNRTVRYGAVAAHLRVWWIQGLLVRRDRDGWWYPFRPSYRNRKYSPLWQGKAVYKWIDV